MPDDNLSPKNRGTLLAIARQSIEAYLKNKRLPEFEIDSEKLMEQRGAFVTLKNKGQLRGCIGLIESETPLCQVVAEMAAAAAIDDPRFSPVGLEELPEIEIEISVLSRPEKITSAGEIQLGRHGVIVKKGFHSGLPAQAGVFLPQVAEETGWNLEEFMNNLCVHKAGLSADAWRTGEVDIYVFTAEVFGTH